MRYAYGSRRYTEKELEASRADAQELIEQQDQRLTPGEQLALLSVRNSELSGRVYQKLMHSTARPTRADFQSIATLGYAHRQANGLHAITPHGQFKADQLARTKAKELGLPLRTQTEIRQDARWFRQPSRAGW